MHFYLACMCLFTSDLPSRRLISWYRLLFYLYYQCASFSCCRCLRDPDQTIDRSSNQINSLLSEIGRDNLTFSHLSFDTPFTINLRQWLVEDSVDCGALRAQQRGDELLLMANNQIDTLNSEILAKGQQGK